MILKKEIGEFFVILVVDELKCLPKSRNFFLFFFLFFFGDSVLED